MARRCSHCSHNGHNSRTCPSRSGVVVKLFGVRLTDGLISKSSSIRKSASMGNLITHHHHHHHNSSTSSGSGNATAQNGVVRTSPDRHYHHHTADGYTSEDFAAAAASSSRERKKGVPWTEEEHRMFLLGLQQLGKGDWRGIARNYVISRTPTQVASHAQKYFMRQCNVSRRKRRSSLFDIVPDESMDFPMVSTDFISVDPPRAEPQSSMRLQPSSVDEECEESMESANSNEGETAVLQTTEGAEYPLPPFAYPAYGTGLVFPMPIVPFCWPSGYQAEHVTHQVVKPTALAHSKSPTNVSELVGMSKLSLGDSAAGPPSLELVQLGSTRPSAFHANVNPSSSGSSIHVA